MPARERPVHLIMAPMGPCGASVLPRPLRVYQSLIRGSQRANLAGTEKPVRRLGPWADASTFPRVLALRASGNPTLCHGRFPRSPALIHALPAKGTPVVPAARRRIIRGHTGYAADRHGEIG